MKISLLLNNINEFFAQMQQKTSSEYQLGNFENILRFPELLGRGYIYNLHLRDGIELHIQEFNLEDKLIIKSHTKYSSIGLHFCLSGHIYTDTIDSNCDLNISSGQSLLTHSNDFQGTMELPEKQKITLVAIDIKPDLLQALAEDNHDRFDNDLQYTINGEKLGIYSSLGKITHAMEIALNQIINCPYQGLTKRLYLEGKTLELIALQLAELSNSKIDNNRYKKLHSDEIAQIYLARDILISSLESPPSLLTLAHMVGLNYFKLKCGFRQVFGTTAFGYLHDYKMERSRLLLESGKMNVTQVATAVGYTNFSHFTSAFKKKFGINSSALRLRN